MEGVSVKMELRGAEAVEVAFEECTYSLAQE